MLRDLRDYTFALWRQTFDFLDKGQTLLSRLAVLVAAVTLGIGVQWGLPEVLEKDVPAWSGPATFIGAILLVAPFLAWREQKTEAESLKATGAPRLEIVWNVLVSQRNDYEMYVAGVRNAGSTLSLSDVTLRARSGWFASIVKRATFMPDGLLPSEHDPTTFLSVESLHPHATETHELFGLSTTPPLIATPDDSLPQKGRFVLEARAKDTVTVTATFEYDPEKRPMIKRVA